MNIMLCSLLILFYFESIQTCFGRVAIGLSSTYGVSNPDEYDAQADVISHMLNLAGNTSYLGFCYITFNFYDEANRTNIYSAAGGCGYAGGIVFHVGHGGKDASGLQWYISDNTGAHVWDTQIIMYSTCQNVFFTFLWSCEQGDVIGGTYPWGTPYGMPYAWRNSNAMSQNGYTNPVGDGLFIGFSGLAPALSFYLEVPEAGRNFVKYFYTYGFESNCTVCKALDRAAQSTFGCTRFADCIFYNGYYGLGRMVVYGCGLLKLHDYGVRGGGGGGGGPIEY